jgi:hypothetical protein
MPPRRADWAGNLFKVVYPTVDPLPRTETFAVSIASRAGRVGTAAATERVIDSAALSLVDALIHNTRFSEVMRRGAFVMGVEAFVEGSGRRGGA